MARVLIDYVPFVRPEWLNPKQDIAWDWFKLGDWPAFWIDQPNRLRDAESVSAFRLEFDCPQPATIRIHVSADNRYRLYVDGQPIGRGPERGDERHWCYESYDLDLSAGAHQIAAMTWWLGDLSPYAQHSIRPGFLLAAEGPWLEKLSTGLAKWQVRSIDGVDNRFPNFTGAKVRIDGRKFPWDWLTSRDGSTTSSLVTAERAVAGPPSGWQDAVKVAQAQLAGIKNEAPPTWELQPARLPAMRSEIEHIGVARYLAASPEAYPVDRAHHLESEAADFTALLQNQKPYTIPPHTKRLVIIDLEDYYCAYPIVRTSAGRDAHIRLHWAESLYLTGEKSLHKGNRNEIEGKVFRQDACDELILDGSTSSLVTAERAVAGPPSGQPSRAFTTLWWEAGRYLQVVIETADEPLTLEEFAMETTGYPLTMEGEFKASDERLERVIPIALRTLQACSHETYMDCPYYEQIMWLGDTRLEVLTTFVLSADDRLPRKAIEMFDYSRINSGLTQSRYPSRVKDIIPPFSLWWVGMVYDHLLWRGDMDFLRQRMNGVRAVCEAYRSYMRPDGLMNPPPVWNYTDWVMEPVVWLAGVPPTGDFQPSSVLSLQLALALTYKARLEQAFGEELLAKRDAVLAKQIVEKVMATFYRPERGLLSDDLQGQHFSEHAQCLAILTGLLKPAQQKALAKAMLAAEGLSRTTIYFSHYLFETFYQLGLAEPLLERLGLWFELEGLGFKTTFEQPEPSRSDCHAWAAHPIFHYYASILGIRPADSGMAKARIAPMLPKSLRSVQGTMPHPRGPIRVELERTSGKSLAATIQLPAGMTGEFVWHGKKWPLDSGTTKIDA